MGLAATCLLGTSAHCKAAATPPFVGYRELNDYVIDFTQALAWDGPGRRPAQISELIHVIVIRPGTLPMKLDGGNTLRAGRPPSPMRACM